jgi:hypothetical protein
MLDVITQIWNAITTDPQIIAFWAGASTPELRQVRLFYNMPDRDEALPYMSYLVSGASHHSKGAMDWPVRDQRLTFSIYDFSSSNVTTLQIATRLQQLIANRLWLPPASSATACRTMGVLETPQSMPTGNKLAVRIDLAFSLRWYDAEVASHAGFGETR